ncbi:MAG: hypothetical protein KAR87_05090 [Candidatus Aenigmarchaeota archaeon]|nr:hypothetical protein [Candidatus Aenigmarchaeota archaeon]
MKKRGWSIRQPDKLVDSVFPHCFTISGGVNWFNEKLNKTPFNKEGHAVCQRCFRHFDTPDKTHLPFFWMLLDLTWNMYPREKVIADNFAFFEECGLNLNKLQIAYWKGGKVYGKGINLKSDVTKACQGMEFKKMQKEGIYIPSDEEAKNAWKKQGIKNNQLIACGEIDRVDPSGLDSIVLNARENFSGVRSEPYYKIKNKKIEIGVFVKEDYFKKTVALKLNLPQKNFEDKLNGNKFLLHLNPRPIAGGFGLERITMVINNIASVFELEPYKTMKEILTNKIEMDRKKERVVENTIAYIPVIIWLVNDGAQLLKTRKLRQRILIYRKTMKNVIQNLKSLNLDKDEIYIGLFKTTIDFYLHDKDYLCLKGLEEVCLKEIYKQKERIEIDNNEKRKREKKQLKKLCRNNANS